MGFLAQFPQFCGGCRKLVPFHLEFALAELNTLYTTKLFSGKNRTAINFNNSLLQVAEIILGKIPAF